MKPTARLVALCFVALTVLCALFLALAGQSPAHASRTASAEPQFGVDIRVNPDPSPTTRKFKNLSMAIAPTDTNHIMAAYEYNDAGTIGSGYSFSTDAGRTWNGAWLLGPWGGDMGLTPFGNPSVGVDAAGNFYYSTQVASQGNDLNGYCIITSTGGTDWGTPVPVAVTSYNEYRDQSYLAVDGRASGDYAGSLYMAWRFFGDNYDGVWVTASRDRGATWSRQVQISDDANQYAYGPSLQVASNGWVYSAFTEFDLACMCYPPKLFIDRSTDGGQTWGTDHMITGQPITATGSLDLKGRELVLLGNGTGGSIRINHYPSFVVSPTDPGTLYAVWNDGRWETTFDYYGNTGRHGDIAFSRSTDGGQTWTEPSRINDDLPANGIDQWQPQIAMGPGELLGVTWYDRRDDPGGYLYSVYYSQSTDGGTTWSTNQRVSDALSDPMAAPDYKGVGDMGFRSSLVYGPDYVLPGWVDGRRITAQDFYTDRGLLPSPSPTATRISTSTPTSSPSVTPAPSITPSHTPTVASTSTSTVTPTLCRADFADVQPSDYFFQAVTYLTCHGAISGYADGTFRPYNNTTRGQLSKIIVLGEGWPIYTSGGPHFTDVPAPNTFYSYIETAYHHNIITGYADGTFRWGNEVTRGQLTKILSLAQNWSIETSGGPHFTDVLPSSPFYPYIETAYHHNIITGYADGTFRPGNNATRGQISKIVYNAISGN